MTIEEVKAMLESIPGFENKVAYRTFPENEAPDLPYICFEEEETDNVFADDRVYVEKSSYTISLCEEYRQRSIERLIEKTLNENDIAWQRHPNWLDSELMYQIDYEMET